MHASLYVYYLKFKCTVIVHDCNIFTLNMHRSYILYVCTVNPQLFEIIGTNHLSYKWNFYHKVQSESINDRPLYSGQKLQLGCP